MANIGIFGGSFDPVHLGHLILAERCRDIVPLDHVVFMPAFQSPLKTGRPTLSDQQRIDLLKLAISGNRHFELSTTEIDRQTLSYTVETLAEFKKQYPDDQLFFMLGSDSLAGFPKWKSPQKICEMAQLLVINRPGLTKPDFASLANILSGEQVEQIQRNTVQSPLIEISSSEIRRRVAAGESIRYLVPAACEKQIQNQKLYQS